MTQQDTDNVSKATLIICIVLSVIATIALLEWQGRLKHSEYKDDFALSTYRAILIADQEERQYRLSHKPSNQSAECVNGYLFIRSDVNDAMMGLLVDYKNRGIKCTSTVSDTVSEAP